MGQLLSVWRLCAVLVVLACSVGPAAAPAATAQPTLYISGVTIWSVHGVKAQPVPYIRNAFFTLAPVSKVVLHVVASGMRASTRVAIVWMRGRKTAYTERNIRWGTPANGRFDWTQRSGSDVRFTSGSYLVRFFVGGTTAGSLNFDLEVKSVRHGG